jgi:hypothetical protein
MVVGQKERFWWVRISRVWNGGRTGTIMLDIVFILATAMFFAIGILYVRGCERLK